MIKSKNIIIEKDFSDTLKIKIHERKLSIASINLDSFNSNIDEPECKIIYNTDDFEFEAYDKLNKNCKLITNLINNFTWWDLQEESIKNEQVEKFINSIENLHFENVSNIIKFNLGTNNLTQKDIENFKNERTLFKLRFKNFYPKGFLSKEQELLIKEKMNYFSDQLDLLY